MRGCTSESNLLADDARSTDSAWSDSEFEDDDVEESHNDKDIEGTGNNTHGNAVTEEHHHQQQESVEDEQRKTMVEEDEVSPRTQVLLISSSLYL